MAKSLIRSTAVVSAGTALSRILGFVREILMARLFGTTVFQSAFTIAFAIPNMFRRLFGEGALSAAFVPVLTETMDKEGPEKANELIGRVVTLLGAVLMLIVSAVILVLTYVLGAVELSVKWTAVLEMLRIMMPYMFFICLVAACMAVLNSHNHFLVSAATPIILNVVWIATLLYACPKFGETAGERIEAVAYGVLVAGVLQLLVQLPVLKHFGVSPQLSFTLSDKKVRRILLLMGPAAVGMGVFQINTVIDRLLAFLASDWGPAALRFSERLVYLPLGIFATALGTVLLPVMSRQSSQSDNAEMRKTVNVSLRNLMLVTVPAAMGLLVLAGPLVQLVFESGEFGPSSTTQTARALMFYAPGLVVFSLYKVFVPAFYARQDMKTPVRIGIWAVAVNLVLNVVFVLTWPYEFKHCGLATATVIASGLNTVVLAWIFHREVGSADWGGVFKSFGSILLAAALMGVGARWIHGLLAVQLETMALGSKFSQLVAVAGSIAAAVVIYAALVSLLCRSEMREITAALRQRRQK